MRVIYVLAGRGFSKNTVIPKIISLIEVFSYGLNLTDVLYGRDLFPYNALTKSHENRTSYISVSKGEPKLDVRQFVFDKLHDIIVFVSLMRTATDIVIERQTPFHISSWLYSVCFRKVYIVEVRDNIMPKSFLLSRYYMLLEKIKIKRAKGIITEDYNECRVRKHYGLRKDQSVFQYFNLIEWINFEFTPINPKSVHYSTFKSYHKFELAFTASIVGLLDIYGPDNRLSEKYRSSSNYFGMIEENKLSEYLQNSYTHSCLFNVVDSVIPIKISESFMLGLIPVMPSNGMSEFLQEIGFHIEVFNEEKELLKILEKIPNLNQNEVYEKRLNNYLLGKSIFSQQVASSKFLNRIKECTH